MKRESNRSHVPIQSHPPKGGSRRTGQGMVEFALALPILLMVMYGLLEAGRLIFIYASTITAARSAVRYGSATGENAGNIPFYRDCDGIDNEVRRLGFINTFDDINVTYDRGLDTSGNVVAIPGIDSNPTADTCPSMNDSTLRNGDRIKVQVVTQWSPIIAIVPSWRGFTITSSSERTILMEVPIGIDPESEVYVPGGALKLTVTNVPLAIAGIPANTFNAAGITIYYRYILFNNATFDLHAPFKVTDTIVTNGDCSLSPSKLAPGGTYTCTGSYVTTQADVDAGYVTNLASVRAAESTSNQTGVTVAAYQVKSLTLAKSASPTIATTPGTTITYTYKLTNSGNVTLNGPYSVSDNKVPTAQITCPSTTIAPGAFVDCNATYAITDTDISNRSVTNTATAKAFFKGFEITSNSSSAKVNTAPLDLTVSASKSSVSTLNERIEYTYTLKNVGTVTLFAPYAIIDPDNLVTNISCPSSSSLAPGQTTTCKSEYYVTQADLDAGTPLIHRATATSNSGSIESDQGSAKVEVTPVVSLALVINPPANPGVIAVGTVLNYSYVITNTGNATLRPPYSITELNLPVVPTCPSAADLPPLATTTCTLSYTVKQSDIDKGVIVNLAVARATYAGQQILSQQATAALPTAAGPRLTLLISAPPTYQFAGQQLTIEFSLFNSGSEPLYPPYAVAVNNNLVTVNCTNVSTSLAIAQTAKCTPVTYTIQPADVSFSMITITAHATAKDSSAPTAKTVTSLDETVNIENRFDCFVYHRFSITPPPSLTFPRVNTMAMSVISDPATSGRITIKSIELSGWNYSSSATQYVSSISFGGSQIVTGSSSKRTDPVLFSGPFTGDPTLDKGITKILTFTFNQNYAKTGNEKIIITFVESTCPILDSSNGTQVK